MIDIPGQSPAREGMQSPALEWGMGDIICPEIDGTQACFRDGFEFPPGAYRIWYLGGAFQTIPGSNDWSVNEPQVAPNDGYHIFSGGGDIGLFPRPAGISDPTTDHYATFAAAVAAYRGLYFDFTIVMGNRTICMRLVDVIYDDNRPGNPNPTFLLTQR